MDMMMMMMMNMSPWNAVYPACVFQIGAIHLNNQLICYDNLEGMCRSAG